MKNALQNEALFRRIEDSLLIAEKRPQFLGFLDEAEGYAAGEYLKYRKDVKFSFWGGHDEAERKMLGFFPDFIDMENSAFPLSAITLKYRDEDILSHRDFLGAFMNLGIERSVIGDILCGEGRTVAFIKTEMLAYFLENIKKIGRVGVTVEEGASLPLPMSRSFAEIKGVVASNRLDSIVALLTKQSREKAAAMIKSGTVLLNHEETLSSSSRVEIGDKLSIKGKGRFIIDDFGQLTGKGRLPVSCRKYI